MCKHIILIILVSTSFSFEAEQKVSDDFLLPKYFIRWSLGKYFQNQFSAVERKDVIVPYQIFYFDTERRNSSKSKEMKLAIRRLFAMADQRKGRSSGVTFGINRTNFLDLVRDMREEIKQEEKPTNADFDQDNTLNTLNNEFDKQFKMKMTWFNRIN
jgi:hypothetical protein